MMVVFHGALELHLGISGVVFFFELLGMNKMWRIGTSVGVRGDRDAHLVLVTLSWVLGRGRGG